MVDTNSSRRFWPTCRIADWNARTSGVNSTPRWIIPSMVRWWPMPWHRASAKKASSSVAPASAFPLPLIRYLVSTAPCTGIAFPPKVRGCITMKMCWIRECSSPGWGWTLWIFSLILHFLVKNVIATVSYNWRNNFERPRRISVAIFVKGTYRAVTKCGFPFLLRRQETK